MIHGNVFKIHKMSLNRPTVWNKFHMKLNRYFSYSIGIMCYLEAMSDWQKGTEFVATNYVLGCILFVCFLNNTIMNNSFFKYSSNLEYINCYNMIFPIQFLSVTIF